MTGILYISQGTLLNLYKLFGKKALQKAKKNEYCLKHTYSIFAKMTRYIGREHRVFGQVNLQ